MTDYTDPRCRHEGSPGCCGAAVVETTAPWGSIRLYCRPCFHEVTPFQRGRRRDEGTGRTRYARRWLHTRVTPAS